MQAVLVAGEEADEFPLTFGVFVGVSCPKDQGLEANCSVCTRFH